MKAVITAGAPVDGEYARVAGTAVKALAPVRGITMLERAVRALRANGVAEIGVVGGAEVQRVFADRVERFADDRSDGQRNVLAALDLWPENGEPLLYATSDMPYIDGPAIASFLQLVPPDALAMPLTEYAAFCARFPDAPPFGIRLCGERVVNGGIFYIPPGAREGLRSLATAMFSARKKPWRMAAIAGPALLARLVMGRLSIQHVERRAHDVLGIPARAVRGCAAELAYDADTVDEYCYACSHP
jgi:hypothetical protein